MNRPHANLIADLAQDLDPVRVLKTRDGMLLTAGAALASILAVALIPQKAAAAGASLELSLLARHALELAQKFHAIYHRHPILQEPEVGIRSARLATMQVFILGLTVLSDLLGLPLPDRM